MHGKRYMALKHRHGGGGEYSSIWFSNQVSPLYNYIYIYISLFRRKKFITSRPKNCGNWESRLLWARVMFEVDCYIWCSIFSLYCLKLLTYDVYIISRTIYLLRTCLCHIYPNEICVVALSLTMSRLRASRQCSNRYWHEFKRYNNIIVTNNHESTTWCYSTPFQQNKNKPSKYIYISNVHIFLAACISGLIDMSDDLQAWSLLLVRSTLVGHQSWLEHCFSRTRRFFLKQECIQY